MFCLQKKPEKFRFLNKYWKECKLFGTEFIPKHCSLYYICIILLIFKVAKQACVITVALLNCNFILFATWFVWRSHFAIREKCEFVMTLGLCWRLTKMNKSILVEPWTDIMLLNWSWIFLAVYLYWVNHQISGQN